MLDQVASYQSNAPKKNEMNFGGNNKKVELRTFTQKQYNFYNLLENTSQHNTRERHHVTYDITVGKLEKTQLKGWLLAEAKPSRCPFPEGWVDQIIDQRGSPPSQRMVTTVHCLKPDDAVKSYFTHRSMPNPDAPVGKCFVCVEIFNLLHLTHTQIGLNV